MLPVRETLVNCECLLSPEYVLSDDPSVLRGQAERLLTQAMVFGDDRLAGDLMSLAATFMGRAERIEDHCIKARASLSSPYSWTPAV
jgi:hypothetical protein